MSRLQSPFEIIGILALASFVRTAAAESRFSTSTVEQRQQHAVADRSRLFESGCETAWAKCPTTTNSNNPAVCLTTAYNSIPWGWTQKINPFPLYCDLWAGAVPCNTTTQGFKVGSVVLQPNHVTISLNSGYYYSNDPVVWCGSTPPPSRVGNNGGKVNTTDPVNMGGTKRYSNTGRWESDCLVGDYFALHSTICLLDYRAQPTEKHPPSTRRPTLHHATKPPFSEEKAETQQLPEKLQTNIPPLQQQMLRKTTTQETQLPINQPTKRPSKQPTNQPTWQPTTRQPTLRPTQKPTNQPTQHPTKPPTQQPTKLPTQQSTRPPTQQPTKLPTQQPTKLPTQQPTRPPTKQPTPRPTQQPTKRPTKFPTKQPTRKPSRMPTKQPTTKPVQPLAQLNIFQLVKQPTKQPTKRPTQTLTCGASVRRAWRDTSCANRANFLQAIQLLKALPANNTLKIPNYDAFVQVHVANGEIAHGRDAFLPWHRWYVARFERALQLVSGKCVTLPYWDWERDAGRESRTSVLNSRTFGTYKGVARGSNAGCVSNGIANYTGLWRKTVYSDGCLKRAFNNYTFATEARVLRVILSHDRYADFRLALESYPHAVPHNFLGENMGTMWSPDDPLFFLHHGNVDRIWTLFQDYRNQDTMRMADFRSDQYSGGMTGSIAMDAHLPYDGAGTAGPFFYVPGTTATPKPRQLLRNRGGILNVTYVNDNLARLLVSVTATASIRYQDTNNNKWVAVAPRPVATIVCSRARRDLDSVTQTNENPPRLRQPHDLPDFASGIARNRFHELIQHGLAGDEAIGRIAQEECDAQGNPMGASPEFISMQGDLKDHPELFRCSPESIKPEKASEKSGKSHVRNIFAD